MASTSVIFDVIARDRNASDTFTKVGNAADRSGSKMAKFGNVAKTAAKTGALALAAGGLVVGKALFDMTKAAAEDEAAQKRLALTLKNTAGATQGQIAATEDWITAQGKALGVADDDLRPALARLATATGDVGKAQKLASLAMDVSAGTGKSLEQVSTALMKAQNGQVSALSRLGINTKNAKGETISFEQAQKRMAETFKGQAAANADTLSGKMTRLKLMLSEAGEEIGAKLIPIVTKMADWFLRKGLPAIEAFGRYLGEKVPPIFDRVREFIGKFTDGSSGKLGGFISDVVGIFKDGVAIAQDLWRLFGDNILQYLKSTWENVKSVLSGAFDIIRGLFKTVSALLKGDWGKAWDGIKLILRGAAKVLKGIVGQLLNGIRFAFKNAGVILHKLWDLAWDGIKRLARAGAEWLVGRIKAIPGAILGAVGRYRDAARGIMGALWEMAKEKVRDGALFIVEKIREIPGRIRDIIGKFREVGGDLVGAIANGIKNAAGFASSFASQIWSAIKSTINSGIDSLNNLLEFSIKVGPKTFTVNPPDIGHLATGTSNWRGGLAVVGEQGPELVNLPRGARVHTASQTRQMLGSPRSLGGAGGGVTVNINGPVYGDPQAFARYIRQELLAHKRALGVELGIA